MGAGRSLASLQRAYTDQHDITPPTQSIDTLKRWSIHYGWQARAESYDAQIERQKTARATEIMHSGLALEHERVEKLERLATFLEEQIYEQGEDGVFHNVWLPDVKQIGAGEFAERVDIERFNSALIDQYRGTLDDLAKETGGRRNKTEVSGPDGGPIETETNVTGIGAGIAEVVALFDKARTRAGAGDPPTDHE